MYRRSVFHIEEKVSAKPLRPECAWNVQTTERRSDGWSRERVRDDIREKGSSRAKMPLECA